MRLGIFVTFVTIALAAVGCAPDGNSDTIPDSTGGDGDSSAGDGDSGDGDSTTTTTGTGGDGDSTTTGPDGPPPPPPPTGSCDEIDVVFVVDDSPSMDEEQTNLAANFPRFIDVIDDFRTEDGDPVDYRVAVTSTGRSKRWREGDGFNRFQTGLDGAFVEKCGMTRPWVEKSDADRAADFSCAARLGTDGPLEEMPLSALRAALTERVTDGANAGFRRADALLAVVFLTDEDDCSREANNFVLSPNEELCDNPDPMSDYKAFLDDAAGGEGRWAAAVIAGPGPGKCTSDFGDAEEAFRLKEFVGLAGANGVFSSICEGDLAAGLEDALATFDVACQNLPRPE